MSSVQSSESLKKESDYDLIQRSVLNAKILENESVPDQEIIESVTKEYLSVDDAFDATKFELLNLPNLLSSKDVKAHCRKLIRQHHIVTKRVLFLILQKQSKCSDEFQNIREIQSQLSDVVTVCKMCRQDLHLATHQFIFSSLQILHYCRKRRLFERILKILYSIKTLYRTKNKLKQLLEEDNYPKVIYLLSECQKAAEIYKQYNCIVALCSNLNDILEQVEENLDLSLSKICLNFDDEKYASIQDAYKFLNKSHVAVDQLQMYFTAAVHNTAYNTALKYAEADTKKQYNDLCKSIPLNSFLNCLIDLCRCLLSILKSYYFIIKWHSSENEDQSAKNPNKQLLLQRLENGISKTYNDIENKIAIYLDGFDLRHLKFGEFIRTLDVADKISKVGNKFCKNNTKKLHKCVREKFINYLDFYHASRLDELKIFLENDGWELCPIKSSFEITQLLEFKTFKYIFNSSQSSKEMSENSSEIDCYKNDDWNQDYFEDLETPFNYILEETVEEDILQNLEDSKLKDLSEDSDDEIPEELKYDYVDEGKKYNILKKKPKHAGPIITNTTLNVLRICGKYLQVTQIFKEVTQLIIQYMVQIFELYFYTVHSFFTVDLVTDSDFNTVNSTNLKRMISRIKDNLIIENNYSGAGKVFLTHKIHQPCLSPVIDLNNSNKLFGLMERVVAVESLICLGQQFTVFQFYLNSLLVDDKENSYVNQFYQQTIPLTTALRKPVYMASISRAFDTPSILNLMNKVDWELKDVATEHSGYIDFLIAEVREFKTKLDDLQNYVPLSKDVYDSIWESVAYLLTNVFVEGFSRVEKCSNGGRALMQLDFTQFVSSFEALTLLRPMPHQDYVASYIKAFYLSESSIESWIKSHSEYSAKHLTGLITCMYQNRKVKQRLMNLIEDQRLSR